MKNPTPRNVMFSDLKRFGRISNYEAAQMLLSPCKTNGQPSPRDRVNERTFLSREIVNAAPGRDRGDLFADFPLSVQNVVAKILSRNGSDADGRNRVAEHYRGEAADAMCAALEEYGIDANPYRNLSNSIAHLYGLDESDRCVLHIMLFIVTGCLGDPRQAATEVLSFIENVLAVTPRTSVAETGKRWDSEPQTTQDTPRLGLMRIVGDAVMPTVHPLSLGPDGTVIGALPDPEHYSIADVEFDVSRSHLRIFQSEGVWYAQGLGSTNGTTLLPAGATEAICIEPPRSERNDEETAPPHEISNGDILTLGSKTNFLVIRIADRK